jgi:uncharacterized protein (DUF1330 family)
VSGQFGGYLTRTAKSLTKAGRPNQPRALNAKHWEFVVLVRYPSRKAFLKMVTSPEYAQANVHRENGVDDHVILASTETYSKFSPPKA